ncbi:MAG: hypothetical protein OIF47_09980 [Marinibacterium sp.]|nr:hypothetical protein [Marinibacterium sp.]
MPWTLNVSHRYPVSADALFQAVADLDQLDHVNRPLLQFDHLPSGPVRRGQVIEVAVSLFGLFPGAPYRMRISECDAQTRVISTVEEGFGVSRVDHRIEVQPAGAGAELIERLSFAAGWRGPVIWLWLHALFVVRHYRRLRFLRRSA